MRTSALAATMTLLLACGLAAQNDTGALVDQLGGSDATQRSNAYSQLQRTRPADLPALLGKRIATFPLEGQNLAGYLLQQYPIETTRAIYRKLLTADSQLLRVTAATALYRSGDRDVVQPLCQALEAARGQELEYAMNRLYGIREAALVDVVRKLVRSDATPAAVEDALYFLLSQGAGNDPATQAAAEKLLQSSVVPRMRGVALAYLVAVGAGDHGADLAKELANQPTSINTLQRFLTQAPRLDAAVLDTLQERLGEAKSPYEVSSLAALLRRHDSSRAITALRKLLDSKTDTVRDAALQAMAEIPGALDLKRLHQMLESGVEQQVLVAAGVLRRMDDDAGFQPVFTMVRAGRGGEPAVRALGAFRKRAAVPALLDVLDNADQYMRQAAWYALVQLLPDLFPYRRFEFDELGYGAGDSADKRAAAVTKLRAWWQSVQ